MIANEICQYFTRDPILPFLLSTPQRENDMNGRNYADDAPDCCDCFCLQHGGGCTAGSHMRITV